MRTSLLIYASGLAILQVIGSSWAAMTVNGEPVKSNMHPVHVGVQVDAIEPRSSFAPTTTNNGASVNMAGSGNGGINVASPVASISRSGQVIYAQNRDSYAQAAASAGYNSVGSSSSGSSASYAAPAQTSSTYGAPNPQQQGSMTYYYYHYPTAQPYGGGETTGAIIMSF